MSHDSSDREAAHVREQTEVLLHPIMLAAGSSALDLGCGSGGALGRLSELVGPSGRVVGIDQDGASLAAARALIREQGLGNVEIVQADARETGLPRSSFDLVHVRMLLVNLPAPEQVVDEVVRLVRPGGWVAAMEPDHALRVCYPPDPALQRLCALLAAAYRHDGADCYVGRRLPHLLATAGMTNIAVEARAPVCPPGHPERALCPDLVRSLRSRILRWGVLEARELDRLDHAARLHLDDPETLSVPVTYFLAWAHKPVWAA